MILSRLAAIPNLKVSEDVLLSAYTRFAIGGPARAMVDASTETALVEALRVLHDSPSPHTVIGGGTNLAVSDDGFPGIVLRFTAAGILIQGNRVFVAAGAILQYLVDTSIAAGLKGLETMTGIPGWVGGAVYGNAGAYGHSIEERVSEVRYFDGKSIKTLNRAACQFDYRESAFKRHKEWIVTGVSLELDRADSVTLRSTAAGIRTIRDEKYPPEMRCAGSIFKNLLLKNLPESARAQVPENVIREGKVPSAYFLEQAGAKGMHRGGIRVADYHANLIYNSGDGTARELEGLIEELKTRVETRFGLRLEEEVQYIGTDPV